MIGLNEHDMRTIRQTASAVVRINKYMTGYTAEQLESSICEDARRFIRDCTVGGSNYGYASTSGYVLSTYLGPDHKVGCYASVSASLFSDE